LGTCARPRGSPTNRRGPHSQPRGPRSRRRRTLVHTACLLMARSRRRCQDGRSWVVGDGLPPTRSTIRKQGESAQACGNRIVEGERLRHNHPQPCDQHSQNGRVDRVTTFVRPVDLAHGEKSPNSSKTNAASTPKTMAQTLRTSTRCDVSALPIPGESGRPGALAADCQDTVQRGTIPPTHRNRQEVRPDG
jgi:hypothetical protein